MEIKTEDLIVGNTYYNVTKKMSSRRYDITDKYVVETLIFKGVYTPLNKNDNDEVLYEFEDRLFRLYADDLKYLYETKEEAINKAIELSAHYLNEELDICKDYMEQLKEECNKHITELRKDLPVKFIYDDSIKAKTRYEYLINYIKEINYAFEYKAELYSLEAVIPHIKTVVSIINEIGIRNIKYDSVFSKFYNVILYDNIDLSVWVKQHYPNLEKCLSYIIGYGAYPNDNLTFIP